MKKLHKLVVLLPTIMMAATSLASCSEGKKILYLRVINSEDYIYLQENEDDPLDMKDQFEQSEMVKEFLKNYPQYDEVKVIYDTSDTNETLFSELQTGKSNYDLMNVSDYMAQKIVASKMAVPLYRYQGATIEDEADYDMIPNYVQYGSGRIKGILDEIESVQKTYDEKNQKLIEMTVQLKDFAVGYMWGTLGILFNPEYPVFVQNGIEYDEVISDMQSFSALWDTKYNGTISIKNSMRDTYALGVMHTYEKEFEAIREEYINNREIDPDAALEVYKEKFDEIFNRCNESNVYDVKEQLETLKTNIFGLEVDSGKQDIITKKIGVNLAWSGDAVYSMDQGEDLNEVKEPVELCYAVPELGSNIWMDAWIMPDCPRSQEQYELAHLWLDFLSDPENAYQNMEYTGYTSFVGGNSILELVRDWYDCRTDEIYQEIESYEDDKYIYDYYQVYATNGKNKFFALDYPDMMKDDHNPQYDSYKLRYFIPYEDEEGELVEEPINLADLIAHSEIVTLEDEETQKTYKDLTIVDSEESECDAIDLTYFFADTLEYDEEEEEGYIEGVDTIFYCYDYFIPLEDEENISVGRQFFCQYPDEETINRCAVMKDYGENNKYVMKMWEEFKSDPLPLWAIIVFATSLAAILGFVTYIVVNKILKNNLRKKRRKNK